jgi:hypothetical protein
VIDLGLTSSQLDAFHLTLAAPHRVDTVVRVLDRSRTYLTDISGQLFDGQVNIDGDADVTRTCTLSLRDPNRALMWDTNSPADGALFFDRMVQVLYVVTGPLLLKAGLASVTVPIFTGPVTKVSRTADVVNVEASGIEQTMIPPTVAYFGRTYAKGMKSTDLVRAILTDLGGETKFTVPDWPDRTTKDRVILFNDNTWATAKDVVGSRATNHLFYDGRGICVLRKTPTTPCFTFRTGQGGLITTHPQVNYDIDDVRNKVRLTGSTEKIVGIATAPKEHPMSTWSLGRNGKERVILDEFTDDSAKTKAAAEKLAKTRLDDLLRQAVDVTFDALVVPHLEPEDLYTVQTPTLSLQARVRQMSIPLKGGTMSVGYNTKLSVNADRIRRA